MCCLQGPRRRQGGVGTASALVVSVCPCVILGRTRGSPSTLAWGWEFSLSVEDGGLGGNSHLVIYTELVHWWLQVGFAVEGITGESAKNQTCGGKK